MKKIHLDLASLTVSSFATAEVTERRGTVKGNSGYTCYHTVALYRTQCADYPESYWGEPMCGPLVEDTHPSICPVPTPTIFVATCPGVTGCV